MNEKILKIVGSFLLLGTIVGAGFYCYQYFQLKKENKAAILITDKVGMTIRVDYLHEDKMHSVDAINVYTSETFYDVKTSKVCPKYKEFKVGTEIDVVQVSYLNGKTGETWKEYDGLYNKVCFDTILYDFKKEDEAHQPKAPLPSSIIPSDNLDFGKEN